MLTHLSHEAIKGKTKQLSFFGTNAKADIFKLIRTIYNHLPHTLNMHLRQTIICNYIEQAISNVSQHGQLVARDVELTSNLELSEKLSSILASRQAYYASPVLTAHPTEIFSDEVLADLDKLVSMALKYRKIPLDSELSMSLEKSIGDLVVKLSLNPLMPTENLTPEQEMLRQDRLYLDMMESWSRFNTRYISTFAKHHAVSVETVKDLLTHANKLSYRNVSSWAVADIDGNKKRSRKTMERMEAGLQTSIIGRYIERTQSLVKVVPSLQSVLDYLIRCRKAISDGIYFNQKGASVAKKRLIKILENCLDGLIIEKEINAKLSQLRDLVDLVGFRGELKQFVRQSSKANADVFDNFVKILRAHFPNIELLAQGQKHYAAWPTQNKEALHHLFRIDSCYFKTLKDNESHLTPDSIRELEILEFVIEYQDQFSYILSDTENYTSLNEVTLLFGYAAYRKAKLYIDEIRRPPVNLIPLCETPDDLANLTTILDQMLSNPYLKEVIISRGELIYVAGPSDLGKEGGIFAHIELIEAEKNARRILESHQKFDSQLKAVQLRVLYGLGSDFHRRVSDAFSQLFCTFQGSDACQLAFFGSYQAYVEKVSGRPSENTVRAQELAAIEQDCPQDYALLKQVVNVGIKGYREFIYHPSGLELFRQLSMPYQLGILTNTSSRGESKNSAPKDIAKSRAIGIANYDISTLLMLRIFMSADGLVELSSQVKAQLPRLYQQSLVVREQVSKIFYAIAVSDEKRALGKIFKALPEPSLIEQLAMDFKNEAIKTTVEQALAYVVSRVPKIIDATLCFLPEKLQLKAREYLLSQDKVDSFSSLVLGMLEVLGQEDKMFRQLHQEIVEDILPRYQRLKVCIDSYLEVKDHASSEELAVLEENVVLALRGDKKVTAGPITISKMTGNSVTELNIELEKSEKSGLKAKL